MGLIHGNYEYAGFYYGIYENGPGRVHAIPHKGQHPAASKAKHLRAAAECFNDDYKWDERVDYIP